MFFKNLVGSAMYLELVVLYLELVFISVKYEYQSAPWDVKLCRACLKSSEISKF